MAKTAVAPPKNPPHRPPIHAPTSATTDRWLSLIEQGTSVRKACKEAALPWGVITRWLATDESFAARYARAREVSAEYWAERAGHVLDATARTLTEESSRVQIARAQSDYAKWRAGRQAPKQWGDRQTVEQDTTLRVVVDYATLPTASAVQGSVQVNVQVPDPVQDADFTVEPAP
jgi:hypothetical protein